MSFLQFLFEGGKATAKYNTKPATQEDIKTALQFVSKTTGVGEDELTSNGSKILLTNVLANVWAILPQMRTLPRVLHFTVECGYVF